MTSTICRPDLPSWQLVVRVIEVRRKKNQETGLSKLGAQDVAMKRTAIAREPRREIDRLGRWYRCWIRGERPHLRLGLLCNFPAAFFRSSFRQIKMLVGYARVRAGATKLFCVDRLFTHFILLPAIYLCSCPLHNIVTINTIENIDNEKKYTSKPSRLILRL